MSTTVPSEKFRNNKFLPDMMGLKILDVGFVIAEIDFRPVILKLSRRYPLALFSDVYSKCRLTAFELPSMIPETVKNLVFVKVVEGSISALSLQKMLNLLTLASVNL